MENERSDLMGRYVNMSDDGETSTHQIGIFLVHQAGGCAEKICEHGAPTPTPSRRALSQKISVIFCFLVNLLEELMNERRRDPNRLVGLTGFVIFASVLCTPCPDDLRYRPRLLTCIRAHGKNKL